MVSLCSTIKCYSSSSIITCYWGTSYIFDKLPPRAMSIKQVEQICDENHCVHDTAKYRKICETQRRDQIRSSHASEIDLVLNPACRAISGCLRRTRVDDLYLLCGIAPPPHISDGQSHHSLGNTNKKTTLCILSMSKIQPERD